MDQQSVFRRNLVIAALAVVLLAAVFPARAQGPDLSALIDRMDRLERDIRTLNLQIARGEAPSAPADLRVEPVPQDASPAYARLHVRVTELAQELRALTGQVEEASFRLSQVSDRLDKLVADIDYRLTQLEQGRSAPVAGSSAPQPPSLAARSPSASTETPPAAPPGVLGTVPRSDVEALDPPVAATRTAPPAPQPPPPVTIREQYQQAFGLLQRAEYAEAEQALSRFMADNPDDPLADNARYWLGETFYVRGDYVRAAETFLEGYQLSPNGPKAADTLLKLGMSLAGLDKNREACATFEKLLQDMPGAARNVRDRATLERERLACQ